MRQFSSLSVVPVHYDRLPPRFPYGSRGKPLTFQAEGAFVEGLDSAFAELWQVCPLGKADVRGGSGWSFSRGRPSVPFGEVEVTRDQDPLQLLHGVYSRVQEELGGSPHRKTVEAAVNSFALHPETQAWLEQYRQDR